MDVRRVGRELGARYVVEGSARRAGERIRIHAQLIDAASGQHVWAEQYDRAFRDVLALQEEIGGAIVGAMYPEIERFDRERAMREDPGNLEAWDWAQRAWWHWYRSTAEDNAAAKQAYERAIELDPRFASAFSGLALAHYASVSYAWTDSPEQSIDELGRLAETAVALDERDAMGHHALGHAYALTGERDKMIAAYERSIEFNPTSALVYVCAGEGMALAGHSDEAIRYLENSVRLSPQAPWIFSAFHALAMAHFAARRYDEAVDWGQRALQRKPDFAFAHRTLAASYAQLGQLDEARVALQEAVRLAPEFTLSAGARVFLTADPETGERYLEGLRLAGLAE